MDRERWQQIDDLFRSALGLAPGERSAFLEEACAGDAGLRREVESLLAHDQAATFMRAPAYEEAARLLAAGGAETLAGQTVGPYEVLERLGAGGMGEVYLALHTRTNRRVALKLLPACHRAALYRLPTLGGDERRLIEDVSLEDSQNNFSLSPDGKQIAFIRLDAGFNRSLLITNLDGSSERKLLSRRLPEFLTAPSWSPDGRIIACVTGVFGGRGVTGGQKTLLGALHEREPDGGLFGAGRRAGQSDPQHLDCRARRRAGSDCGRRRATDVRRQQARRRIRRLLDAGWESRLLLAGERRPGYLERERGRNGEQTTDVRRRQQQFPLRLPRRALHRFQFRQVGRAGRLEDGRGRQQPQAINERRFSAVLRA
jgi:hypothetical protein